MGASNNERLLAAAKSDNEDLLLEIFDQGSFDINHQDGLGNTALHYAASYASNDVLEHILSHDECDVDPTNKLERATPLHLAVRLEDPEAREYVVQALLDAGADLTIRDKNGDTALDLVRPDDTNVVGLIRKAQAEASIDKDDIAYDDDDDIASDGSD